MTESILQAYGGVMSNTVSDEDLVAQLKAKGIQIARRTVAKYRTELGVLPSHLRRSY